MPVTISATCLAWPSPGPRRFSSGADRRIASPMACAAMLATGWLWLDAVTSLVIALVIVLGAWRLLRDAMTLALHAVPPEIDPGAVREHLAALAGVGAVHDLHIWPMSTTETALTC